MALLAAVSVFLAAVAFFLGPAGHANIKNVVQINGTVRSVPSATLATTLAGPSALSAHPGSELDVCGDVVAMGSGAAPVREVNGRQYDQSGPLPDGAVLTVRQGEPVLEGVTKTSEDVPFAETVTGQGNIVSLAQMGSPGERDIYSGETSGLVAASVITVAPKDTILELRDTPLPEQKLAALTFDDGPGTHTLEILAALASKHVPATFFVQGSIAAAYPDIIEQEKAAGNEVENHSWNHPWLTKLSSEEIYSQIARTNNAVGGCSFLRPPYGDCNATVRSVAASLGMKVVFWTVDTRDWERQDVDAIMSHVKAETKPGAIILMHDGGKDRLQTVAAIPIIVDWLFSQGYSLTTVDQIL